MTGGRPRDVLGVDASLILDTAHEAFVAMGVDGHIVEWNAAAEDLFGWSRSEALGHELADLIIPARLRSAHRQGLRRYLETGTGPVLEQRVELPAVRRDGTEIHVEITISAVTAEAGRFFHAFLHDITSRIGRDRLLAVQLDVTSCLATARSDEGLRAALAALGHHGRWVFAGVWQAGDDVEVLHDYVSWATPDADLRAFASASRAMGFHRGRGLPGIVWATAEPVWNWTSLTPDDFPRVAIAGESGLRSGSAVPLRSCGEVVGVLEVFGADPQETDAEQRAFLRAVAPTLAEFLGRRRAERSADAEKDSFVAMVSHELRTPLTAINSLAQTALDHGERHDASKHTEFFGIILEQGRRLARIVDDLLTMERLHAHGIVPRSTSFDLEVAARESIHELGLDGRFELHVEPHLPLAWGDRDLCKQVIVNYLQNAQRHGAPPYVVRLESADDRTSLRVSVIDRGAGVPEAFEPHLFERFSRADDSASPGTGLGLAIVAALAAAQNGRAWHERVTPHGARFLFELPAAAER